MSEPCCGYKKLIAAIDNLIERLGGDEIAKFVAHRTALTMIYRAMRERTGDGQGLNGLFHSVLLATDDDFIQAAAATEAHFSRIYEAAPPPRLVDAIGGKPFVLAWDTATLVRKGDGVAILLAHSEKCPETEGKPPTWSIVTSDDTHLLHRFQTSRRTVKSEVTIPAAFEAIAITLHHAVTVARAA